jgi:hypothetical protein
VCFIHDVLLQQKDVNTRHLLWLKLHPTECLHAI